MAVIDIKTLMSLDRETLASRPEKTIHAKNLSSKLGQDVDITIQAVSLKRFQRYMGMGLKEDGNINMNSLADAQALVVVEGVKSPDLRDKDLQEHFGAATAKDLAFLFFPGGELIDVFTEIRELTGLNDEEDGGVDAIIDDVKNA